MTMASCRLALLCGICLTVAYVQATITQTELADIRDRLTTLYVNDKDIPAGMLRLIFHDCASAACDGCIDISNSENAGLEVYMDASEVVYNDILNSGISLSRADFWAIAAAHAVNHSITPSCPRCTVPTADLSFRVGRQDCATSPYGEEWVEFPSSFSDTDAVLSFFNSRFGFDEMESTAILGAHTLGRAHHGASGFIHPWTQRNKIFDNQFYIDLLDANGDKGWHQIAVRQLNEPPSSSTAFKYQWESVRADENSPAFLMLDSDVALIKDLGVIADNGQVSCEFTQCPTTERATALWVNTFANDNEEFIRIFAQTFNKMITHGYTALQDPTA